MMKRTLSVLIMIAALSTAQGAVTYSGQLSAENGLSATGQWDKPSTAIQWTIDDVTTPGLWHYEYAISVEEHSIDFMILEVSDTLSSDNLMNLTSNPANWTTSVVQSYSNDSAWLKIEGPEKSPAITVSFDSDHAPGWGDFYATDGRRQHLYNEGLGSTDPLSAATNGSLNNHILAPGSVTFVAGLATITPPNTVPAPGAILLASLGVGLTGKLKRKWCF